MRFQPGALCSLVVAAFWLGSATGAQAATTTCTAGSTTPPAGYGWDNSGNSLLNGSYYFRYVQYIVGDQQGDLSQAYALYQTITFDGNGSYSINGMLMDSSTGASSAQKHTYSGTYSISSCGFGFLSNPLPSGSGSIWGMVAQNGVFLGSTTETNQGFNDLFLAAPLTPMPGTATLNGTYSVAYLNFLDGFAADTVAAGFQMSPNGADSTGTVNMLAYSGVNPAANITEAVNYSFVNGAGILSFPGYGPAIAGLEYLYITSDGNFIFGGAPDAFDFFVGVRTALPQSEQGSIPFVPANFGGLYYQAGIDEPISASGGALQTYFGAFNAVSGNILDHQRILAPLQAPLEPLGYLYQPYGNAFVDTYQLGFASTGGYTDTAPPKQYVVGANGAVRIGFGVTPSLGISVALQAPGPYKPAGAVYIDPTRVTNAASYAPFTAGVSPGEIINFYGSNFAPQPSPPGTPPYPTMLENVQVMINGTAVPILYVSPTQISAIVPSDLMPSDTTGQYAQIQVISNGTPSNVVTAFINQTAPGVFTQTENGLGSAAAFHANGLLVTPTNPAMPGETLNVYVTGLGMVSPAGILPSGPYLPTAPITATIGGAQAQITFPGLPPAMSPSMTGLNQIQVQVPMGASGNSVLALYGPDSHSAQATIPVGAVVTP